MVNKLQVQNNARTEAVAGIFYPSDSGILKNRLLAYFEEARNFDRENKEKRLLRALIAPHAGYDYSGLIAASAYGRARGSEIETVFLIGQAHRAYFLGAAIDSHDYWQTPLGGLKLDKKKAGLLVEASPKIRFDPDAHAEEHTIEVQLPFLLSALKPGFKIVPILIGQEETEKENSE